MRSFTPASTPRAGFGDELHREGDTFQTQWRQIAADFRLYVEHGIHAPGTMWGMTLGATTRETPIGLEVTTVAEGGRIERGNTLTLAQR